MNFIGNHEMYHQPLLVSWLYTCSLYQFLERRPPFFGFCWLFLLPPVEPVESVLVLYEIYINDIICIYIYILYINIHTLYVEVSSISWAIPAQAAQLIWAAAWWNPGWLQSQGINWINGGKWLLDTAGWWFEPLWKIWLRQLGWWHSQYMESHKIHVPNHQPVLVCHVLVDHLIS